MGKNTDKTASQYSDDEAIDTVFSLSANAKEQLIEWVSTRFQDWKQARMQLEISWQESWRAYLCQFKASSAIPSIGRSDCRSHIYRPVLYEAVETIHSFLMNTLFPSDEKFFAVMGQSEADHKRATQIEELLRNKLEQCGFFEKYGLFLKQAVITGNSIAMVPWRCETRTRTIHKPIMVLGVTIGSEVVEETEAIFDGPDFDVLDMFDVVLDPNQPDWNKTTVIRRVTRSLAELHQCGHYHHLESLTAYDDMNDPQKQSKRLAFGITTIPDHEERSDNPDVTLYEAWGDFYIDGQWFKNYVCTVANGKELIRFEPNPYWNGKKPFVFTTLIPVPNEVYGLGAIEKSLGLQHAVNALTNQKLDVINISINNPFTYLINDDVFDPETLVTRPGALIPVKSHDTLKPIQYLNNYTVAFSEIDDLKQEILQATGAFTLRGFDTPSSSTKTATEISAVLSGNHQKFSSFTKHLEVTSLEPALRLFFDHMRQFTRTQQATHCVNECNKLVFSHLRPDELRAAQCQFRVIGSEANLLKAQELVSLLEFIKLVQQDSAIRSTIDVVALYKKIYRRLGFRDDDQLFHMENKQ